METMGRRNVGGGRKGGGDGIKVFDYPDKAKEGGKRKKWC